MEKVLVINPGSTSTKIAVYEDEKPLFVEGIDHDPAILKQFSTIPAQFEMRKELILETMEKHGVKASDLTVVVARGGLLPPVPSGAIKVNGDMVEQLTHHAKEEHASNLGAIISYALSQELKIPAFVYDPVTVDEMDEINRITGIKEIKRVGMGHNLNMRACALKYAQSINKPYNELNIIVAHLGGGITLSLHNKGRMVDMISDNEGPFSPERAGGLPTTYAVEYVFDNKMTFKDFMEKTKRHSGLDAHLGVKDAREVEAMIADGNQEAKLVYEALALNIAKNIAKLAPVVDGQVDAIILTGGIAYSKMLTEWIIKRVQFIAPVVVLAGENEMEALA